MSAHAHAVTLLARPDSLPITASTTAIIVNDMQNAFCSAGGYLDLLGFDISGAAAVIGTVKRVITAARTAGIVIVHSQNGFAPDLADIPSGSPWWHKSPALRHMRAHPAIAGKIMTEGTWDFAILDELKPVPGELVIRKTRPSCFAGTPLEILLRSHGITTLVVIGIAINVGVEWTLREAMSREFYGVLVEDATMPAGPELVHQAAVYNVEKFIGWVTDTAKFEAACLGLAKAR